MLRQVLRKIGIKTKPFLERIDNNEIVDKPAELRCFIKARDEALRLPFLLEYYRQKGVDRFFVIDNGSTDGTREFLLSQKDVLVFEAKERFSETIWGMEWTNALLESYGKNHWCVVSDADELLFYPHAEKLSIKYLCNFLERRGFDALHCLLLDMYSDKPFCSTHYTAGDNPLSACKYFDAEGYSKRVFSRVNHNTFEKFSAKLFVGGMRKRLFGIDACLSKFPLLKFRDSLFLSSGAHLIDGANVADMQGSMLHVKFLSDFCPRAIAEAGREEYMNHAQEYKAYAKRISENPNLSAYYDGSVKFVDSRQLVGLKLMKTSKEFEGFAKAFQQRSS